MSNYVLTTFRVQSTHEHSAPISHAIQDFRNAIPRANHVLLGKAKTNQAYSSTILLLQRTCLGDGQQRTVTPSVSFDWIVNAKNCWLPLHQKYVVNRDESPLTGRVVTVKKESGTARQNYSWWLGRKIANVLQSISATLS